MAIPSGSQLRGVDEFFNSAGTKFAPLGFGFSNDWEVIERIEVTASVATVDLDLGATGFDPELYDEYEITISGLTNVNNATPFVMRTSTDGGSTYDAGVSDYSWFFARSPSTVTPAADTRIGDDADASLRLTDGAGNVAGELLDLVIRVSDLSSAADFKRLHWLGTGRLEDGAEWYIRGSGARLSSTAVNGIRFVMGGGNIDGGTFILRGRRRTPVSLISQDDWVVIDDQTGISAVATHDVFWDDQVYDEIEVTVSGLVIGTDNQAVEMLLSTDGSTFLSGAGDYRWAWHSVNSDTGGVEASDASNSDTVIDVMPALGTATDEHVDAVIHLKNVSNATRKKIAKFQMDGITQAAFLLSLRGSAILIDNNNSLRGFRLDGQGATTFSADRIRVRGRRLTPTGVLKQDWEVLQHTLLTGNQATIEFANLPVHEFDEFELKITDVGSDTSAQVMGIEFSSDNGATWKTGASDYHYSFINLFAESSTASINQSNANANIVASQNFDSASDRKMHGNYWLGTLVGGSAKNVRFIVSAINDSGNGRIQVGGGQWVGTDSDATTTAFRLMLVTGGNFTSGSTFTLRGRRKA